jgi:hypothetical protein
MARNIWPVPSEDASAERVGFALPGDPESGSFKAEIKAADSGEQAADGEVIH